MTGLLGRAVVLVILVGVTPPMPVAAQSLPRERTRTWSDGTVGMVVVGEQVREGVGNPPATWRNIVPGVFPTALVFRASTVMAPDATVVKEVTYDVVTSSCIIPLGIFAGDTADVVGEFVPGTCLPPVSKTLE